MTERKGDEAQMCDDLEEVSRLLEIGELCARKSSNPQHCFARILDAAIAITGADKGNVQLLDADSGALCIFVQRGFDDPFLRFFARVEPDDKSACSAAMRAGERVIVEEVTESNLFLGHPSLEVLLDARVRAVQSTPLVSGDGKLLGMISTHFTRPHRPQERELAWVDLLARQAADFLERKRGEEELFRVKAELRRRAEFLATLAYELKNPLVPSNDAIQIPRARILSAAEVSWSRGAMERQAQELTWLGEDLTDPGCIGLGRMQLRAGGVTIDAVVATAIEICRPLIDAKDHELSIALPRGAVYLDADAPRLTQALSTLLNNAAIHTRRGGHVWLTAELHGDAVVISIGDTGIGIAPNMLPHVFDKFSQATPAPDASDDGLRMRLPQVRSLVELHGGSIEARSDGPDRGCEFMIRLPVVSGLPLGAAPLESDARYPGASRRRALIVDDSRDGSLSLAALLRATGHDVHTAFNGAEAIVAAARFRPQVIVLDIATPKLSGYDTCQFIRKQRWAQGVVFIALTGSNGHSDRRRTVAAGFHHHLVKPVKLAALVDALDAHR